MGSDRPSARVIDCHGHYNPAPYIEALLGAEGDPALEHPIGRLRTGFMERFPLLYGGIDQRLELMDAAGIGRQLVSMGAPYAYPSSPELTRTLSRLWNDGAHEMASQHPDRFGVLAAMPLPDVDGAIAEIQRVAERPTTAGWLTHTHPARRPIDDPEWQPVYELLDELGAVVFLHPDGFCAPEVLKDYGMNWGVGTQFDDTIAVIRLYSSGINRRFPGIRWIVPHLGGAFPFVLGRLDDHWQRDKAKHVLEQLPSESLDNIFFDTASHDAAAIQFGVRALGGDRVLCGSDFPMIRATDLSPIVRDVAEACSTDVALQVLHENTERLFGFNRSDS